MTLDAVVIVLSIMVLTGNYRSEKYEDNFEACSRTIIPWCWVEIFASLGSFSAHLWLINDVRHSYIRSKVYKTMIGAELTLFVWLLYGYISFFSNKCDTSI